MEMAFDLSANRIKVWRTARRITQAGLARKCGVCRQTIANVENGRKVPSLLLVLNIMYFLDAEFVDLYPKVMQTATRGYDYE